MKWFVLIGSESHIALKAAEMLTGAPGAGLVAVFVDAVGGGRLASHAQQRGIPVYRADLIRTDGATLCSGLAGDWLINAYGTVIVPPAVLRLFVGRALNVHPGPLPEYGGLHMNQWALRNGETQFGATIHLMDESIDTGPIVSQEWFDIAPTATGLTLFNKTQRVATGLLQNVLGDIMADRTLRPVPQDLSRLRIYRHAEALDGSIDWRWSARQIVDFVRAGNYRPFVSPTYTAYVEDAVGAQIAILKAEVGGPVSQPPGTVVEVEDRGPRIACGTRSSVILVKAEANETALSAADWRRRLSGLQEARLRGRNAP
jgi:methionyl-tRNA formyltransferase